MTYTRVMSGIEPDTTGLEAIRDQPEFNEQLWQYLNRRVSDWRIIAGKEEGKAIRAAVRPHRKRFRRRACDHARRLGHRIGIRRSARREESHAAGHSVAGDAGLGRAAPARAIGSSELINALTIVQRGWSTPAEMVGSWAGAMGHTQWMPEVWLHLGIDYDHDGKISPYGAPGRCARHDRTLFRRARQLPARRALGLRGAHRRQRWRRRLRAAMPRGRRVGVTRADGAPFPQPNAHGAACGCRCPAARRSCSAPNFFAVQQLQSVDELRARALSSRRPLRRRRAIRAAIPRRRTARRRSPRSRKSSAASPRSASTPAAPTAASASHTMLAVRNLSAQDRHGRRPTAMRA